MQTTELSASSSISLVQSAESLGHDHLILIEGSRDGSNAIGFLGIDSSSLSQNYEIERSSTEIYKLDIASGTLDQYNIDPAGNDYLVTYGDFRESFDFSDDLNSVGFATYSPHGYGQVIASVTGDTAQGASGAGYYGVQLSGDGTRLISNPYPYILEASGESLQETKLPNTGADYLMSWDSDLSSDGRYYVRGDAYDIGQTLTFLVSDTLEGDLQTSFKMTPNTPINIAESNFLKSEVLFSPDDTTIAVAIYGELILVNTHGGLLKHLEDLEGNYPEGSVDLAWSADSSMIAIQSGGNIRIFNADDGSKLYDFSLTGLDGEAVTHIDGISFSADGKSMLFGSDDNNLVQNDTAGTDIFSVSLADLPVLNEPLQNPHELPFIIKSDIFHQLWDALDSNTYNDTDLAISQSYFLDLNDDGYVDEIIITAEKTFEEFDGFSISLQLSDIDNGLYRTSELESIRVSTAYSWQRSSSHNVLKIDRDIDGDGIADVLVFESADGALDVYSSSGGDWTTYILSNGGAFDRVGDIAWRGYYNENSYSGFTTYDISTEESRRFSDWVDLDNDGIQERFAAFNYDHSYREDDWFNDTMKVINRSANYVELYEFDEALSTYKDLGIRTRADSWKPTLIFEAEDDITGAQVLETLSNLPGYGETGFYESLQGYEWYASADGNVDYDAMVAFTEILMDDTIVSTTLLSSHSSVALIGTPRSDANGLKEAGSVHLGNGVYLTDSRNRLEADGSGLSSDLTFIHGHGTDAAQEVFVVSASASEGDAQDLDGSGADEIAMINTGVDAGHQMGMVIYAEPNEAQGDFSIIGYSRSEDGEFMRQYDVSISAGSYQNVTLKNRTEANDVWVTDGLPIPTDMLGGFQGSGVFQEIDGEEYLAGILVGPWQAGTDQAFVVDSVGDNYAALADQMLQFGDADDYATNLLIGQDGNETLRGTGLNEIFKGGNGHDRLHGEGGSDELFGGEGDDRLYGGEGDDRLYGGAGNDRFDGGAGADHFDGGEGTWGIVNYTSSAEGVVVDMTNAAQSTGDAAGDTFENINVINGSKFGDTIVNDGSLNRIHAGDGDDVLVNTQGHTHLFGQAGADTFVIQQGSNFTSIRDFSSDEGDMIDLSGWGITGLDDANFVINRRFGNEADARHDEQAVLTLYDDNGARMERVFVNTATWDEDGNVSLMAEDFIFA